LNQFDRLLADIRGLAGFERFLLTPSEDELKQLATFGPIVVFNISDIRSDAFIVTTNDIRCVSLPLLRSTDLENYTKRFFEATHTVGKRDHAHGRNEIHVVLKWLWDVAVGYILDELGFKDHDSRLDVWPRVWWVGCELLNVLPIHAAGYHELGSTRNVIDRVISSYTPTLKALKYARERSKRAAKVTQQKAMLIGWPEESEEDDLAFVSDDIEIVNSLLSPHIQATVLQKPDRKRVLSRLGEHHIVHFSCHGYSSATNPSESRLLLKNWRTDPLTVSDLTASNIPFGQFAFLSACHSASSRDLRLLSESINLSSATGLAGYPSVIGTLWKVGAMDSAEIAKDVYEGMLEGNKLEHERYAKSLHDAVRKLRDRTRILKGFTKMIPTDPLIWAPFIHIGV
jgi:CHAT domain